MTSATGLTVGHIPYLNCVPCFHYLKESGFVGELVSGVPSALNDLLQQKELDISPSSSFEYARNWKDYLLLPGHSISSVGKVKSVLLFSPVDLAELAGQRIAITGESATSINLLRIILHEFVGLDKVLDAVPDEPVESVVTKQRPALLIGDRALQLAADVPAGIKVFDLGEIWYQKTGLPFVFALWMVQRESLQGNLDELIELSDQLHQSYDRVMSNPRPVAEVESVTTSLSIDQIIDYWHSINYRLDEAHLEGLNLFFTLCVKYGLLQETPPLNFFQLPDRAMQISG